MAHVLRIGVAGLGRAGTFMMSALVHHPDIAVTAAADLNPEHLEAFARNTGGETYTSVDDLCRSPNVDAVYISTPHEFHVTHALLAARNGKHLIVEKPMALTLADCDEIIAAVGRAGVSLVVGHTASFNPAVIKMRELIAESVYGRLGMLSAGAYTDFLYRPRRPEELVTELGGGIMYNQVPHQVDAVRFLAGGMVRSVKAVTCVLDDARPTEGSYVGLLEFENGVGASLVYSGYDHFRTATLLQGNSTTPIESFGATRRRLADRSAYDESAMRASTGYGGEGDAGRRERGSLLQGELGVFVASCRDADLVLGPDGVVAYSNEGLREIGPVPWRGMAGRGNVIDELYYAVTEGRPILHDGSWAKATTEVCIALLTSSRERREVRLEHQVPVLD